MERSILPLFPKKLLGTIAFLGILLITFLTFRPILGYGFTGVDDYSSMEASKISSPGDFLSVVTTKVFNGYGTTPFGVDSFYRPVFKLTFSLDYALFGLNPFGYHLTDLILQCMVAAAAFFLMLSLFDKRIFAAFLGALIVAIHPVLVDIMPISSRRGEILVTLFIILSVWAFATFLKKRKKSLYLLSLFLFAICLGTKEMSVVMTGLFFAYAFLFHEGRIEGWKDFWRNSILALKLSAPFLGISLVFLFFRTLVLGGFGGYTSLLHDTGFVPRLKIYFGSIRRYFIDLLHPGGIAGEIASPFPGRLAKIISVAAVCLLCLLIAIFRRDLGLFLKSKSKGLTALNLGLSLFAAACLSFIVLYPFLAGVSNDFFGRHFRLTGKVIYFLPEAPGSIFDYQIRNFLFILFPTLLFVTGCFLVIINRRPQIRKWMAGKEGKTILFLSAWIALPLILFWINFADYYTYVAVFPFAGIASLLTTRAFSPIAGWIRKRFFKYRYIAAASSGLAVVAILAFYFFFVSSLPGSYSFDEWQANAAITQNLMAKLEAGSSSLPLDSSFYFTNLPRHIFTAEESFTHPKEVVYPYDNTFQSWLNFYDPSTKFDINARDSQRVPLFANPRDLELRFVHLRDNEYEVDVVYDY